MVKFWEKLFPKKPEPKEDTIARIHRVVDKLEVRSRQYETKASDSKIKATRYVRRGDRKAAKMQLRRRQRYLRKARLIEQEIDLMERGVEAINQARGETEVIGALQGIGSELQNLRETASPEIAREVILETQALIEEAEATEEILGLGLDDEEMDADVEAELEDIETMIALEEAGQLPSVPEGEEVLETSEERRERTRKELERMKKEVQE
ncbi:MAG: Snf7 family protein [Candidatus Hermodarchaeota archaeon]|nr:Snf7 family protein [Candidatus Hermodarchaeota archaeon]